MSDGDLSVVVAAQGADVVLAFSGELDLATAPWAATVVDGVFAEPPPRVVLDLSGLRFMDTCGVDVLNRCAELGRAHGTVVEHRGASGIVAALLAMPILDIRVEAGTPALSWN